jgi:hypothetical protein
MQSSLFAVEKFKENFSIFPSIFRRWFVAVEIFSPFRHLKNSSNKLLFFCYSNETASKQQAQ